MLNNHEKISHALVVYDELQSKKKGWNPHFIGIALGALERLDAELAAGSDLHEAIVSNFTGRLLDRVLKSVGLPKSTDEEQHR